MRNKHKYFDNFIGPYFLIVKLAPTICLLLLTGTLFSQDRYTDLVPIDKTVLTEKITDPAALSRLLTASCTTEKEKVTAIFHWITDHISYYRVPAASKKRKREPTPEEEEPDAGPLKPLTERVAIKVLQDRYTYCDGYSRLFQSLCDHAGIRSEIITGYARADMNRTEEKFRSNHSWNAVSIDSAWYLLDVTWASGYIARSTGEFVRHYDAYYFLTPPDEFIRHHYPDDLRWTLLSDPPPLYEFRYTPFRQRSFVKYDITAYSPARGIIEVNVGDTIHLELETNNNIAKGMTIAPDSLWDSASLLISPLYTYIKPDALLPGNKVSYSFRVDSDAVGWLHVMYNDDAVLRYRLNVKKQKK